ncbi:glucose/arabinose dehydrogenase [Lysobacter niastensis]|uniref:Glucose/arabinose dehydrogenase n=1 Tax=Lysobacter niastensis TaxID=380629 RepID=A0ABU1WAW7_9GAMM|nr:PQQ-dependent sugar dehydrogenase [Lysobacter niastensis]MDR7134751.1 glucose/arabinose dehydrogenase [Lysobacter niastensis]
MVLPMRTAWRVLTGMMLAAVIAACGGGGGGDGGGSTPPMGNRAPTITSSGAVSVPEETAGAFHTVTASDPDGNTLTFSLRGGTDEAQFRITSAGGLSFVTPPDFEAPADANRDNVYIVVVNVSDGSSNVMQTISVTVTDVVASGFRVRRVATGLDQPVFLAPVPDGTGRVFVVELPGRIRIMTPSTGATAPTLFLDVSGEVSIDGERGLLGFATAPDFNTSGRFFVYLTIRDGTIEVRQYRTLATDRNRADPATADAILRIPHSTFNNHNGGWIGFGPGDNLLYIAVGDGGGSGDPNNNAQNTNSLLGKILRIDPASDAFPSDPTRDYAIPAGNPFAAGGGAPEVWAYGLRNPFRNSFDPQTGNLFIGDVGQNAVEEIDLMRPGDAGANFGWPILEGTAPFRGGSTAGLTPPVAEYRHGSGDRQGNTVIGGHVFTGLVDSLRGLYIFADFVTPNVWSVPVSRLTVGTTLPASEFTVRNADFAPGAGAFTNIVSFGVDSTNNLYLVDLDGEIFVIERAASNTPTAASFRATPLQVLERAARGARKENRRQ